MEPSTTSISTAVKRAAIDEEERRSPALFSYARGSANGQRIPFNNLEIRAFDRAGPGMKDKYG
jgi:hypothetical protein